MRKVEVITNIRSKPSKIISAFTDPDMLREWWNVERTLIDTRPDGLYALAWNISPKGFGFVSTGITKTYHPDSTLIVDNFLYLNPEKSFLGPMTLAIRAQPTASLTELYLCQDGYQDGGDWDWYYEAVKEAWPATVQTLKDYLEAKPKIE